MPKLNQELLKNPEVREILKEYALTGTLTNASFTDEVIDAFISRHTKPTVSLITEDGIEITRGDQWLWCVDPYDWTYTDGRADTCSGLKPYLYFSTKEAVEHYILWNKPMLSGNEVWDWFRQNFTNFSDHAKHSLEQLLKSK